jgi:hypothetical protein
MNQKLAEPRIPAAQKMPYMRHPVIRLISLRRDM